MIKTHLDLIVSLYISKFIFKFQCHPQSSYQTAQLSSTSTTTIKSFHQKYAWWFSKEDDSFDPLESSDINKGFNESLDIVKSVFKEQGPFDGILAFSQGAAFLQTLLHLVESDSELANIIQIRFAILVSSFFSRSSQFSAAFQSTINTPCLLIYGNSDKVIPPELTIETFDKFIDKTLINHEGGHFLPMNASIKDKLLTFLNRFQ